jgi:hypothetical protein
VKSKFNSILMFSLTSGGLFLKNSSWKAKQSIPYATVTFYGDCVKMCEGFAPKFGDRNMYVASRQRAASHFFTTRKFLPKSNATIVPYSLHLSLFPRLEIKLKGRHFDTIEVMEAESQAVLNTLTEHDFQDASKKINRSSGNGAKGRNGTTTRVMVASRPRVSF